VAGAYADTGDIGTALRTLEIPALRHKVEGRWQVRLWVAYADLLEKADRQEEARRWITLAADTDTEGLTDAAERLGRPAPARAEQPTWADDEQISVLDAYDPDADAHAHADAEARPARAPRGFADSRETGDAPDAAHTDAEGAAGVVASTPERVLTPSPDQQREEDARSAVRPRRCSTCTMRCCSISTAPPCTVRSRSRTPRRR